MTQFHALLPVCEEADIIGQCLRQLLTWADAIYVFDTGSVDATWEIVQQFAAADERVIPLMKDAVYFSEKRLRGWMFHHVRAQMQAGDWFLRVDADEFHDISPPEFVKTRMREHETVAYHQYYDFHLTASEVQNWEQGGEGLSDRSRPIEERRRWFTAGFYTEPRLCRYRESMQWPETVSFPYNAGYVAAERLPIRHYPHRDPVQLNRRCRLRGFMRDDPDNSPIRHWSLVNWREHVAPNDLPQLRYWKPGTTLPELHYTNHLAAQPKRLFQRVAHAWFLPLLDRCHAGYSAGSYPRRLRSAVIDKFQSELARSASNCKTP